MHKEQRLRRRRDFARAYREGAAYRNQLLVLRVLPGDDVSRFGFVVGKVVGGAVVRNRIKRRLRAIADAERQTSGFDVVIGARKPAADASFDALRRAYITLMDRSRRHRRAPVAQETP